MTCDYCEGHGILAKNFGIDSPGTPEIVTCPDCGGLGKIAPVELLAAPGVVSGGGRELAPAANRRNANRGARP